MAIYVVVEGYSDRCIYNKWISHLEADYICHFNIGDAVNENDVYIVSARGYPDILDVINGAVKDVNEIDCFERLVVSVDSEDSDYRTRHTEIKEFIEELDCLKPFDIIIQHFCIETWLLGNKVVVRRNPSDSYLKSCLALFDVRKEDPEQLPEKKDEGLNRAQFAFKYLKAVLRDRYNNITYIKSRPEHVSHKKYFKRVYDRWTKTGHIPSFEGFVSAFKKRN